MKLNGKRTLVTGAAGFIGSHVAQHCVESGMQVVAIDDLSGGFRENVPEGCVFEHVDVVDANAVESVFDDHGPFDCIYHLAAYAAEGLSHFIRNYNYTNNLTGSVNLLNSAVRHEVKCFVFTSSIAVYGAGQTPMTETLTPIPEDPYGIAKYAFELDLQAAKEMFDLDYVIFRPHNVYGERQNIGDKYRNVIGIFMNQLLQGMPMTVFGDGTQTRAFSYVGDVAPAIAQSPFVKDALNQTFNIGADKPYTVLELGEEVAKALRKEPEFKHLDARKEVVHAFADHGKVNRVFSLDSSTSLATGIQKMADWVMETGPQQPVNFSAIELTKNLPDSWRV